MKSICNIPKILEKKRREVEITVGINKTPVGYGGSIKIRWAFSKNTQQITK